MGTMIKIFHTADVHVGLKFTRGYPDSLQQALVQERIAVIARMADMANQEGCDLFVVAGDLFDSVKVSKKLLRETAESLARFEGLVAVLPGNHDYAQEVDDPIWGTFADAIGERHLVLRQQRPYDLGPFDIPAILYPGACTSRHSQDNAIGWISDAIDSCARGQVRVGIAHGSLDGLSPDFHGDYYPMTRQELEAVDVHVWLLGHTHVRFPDQESGRGARIFYPSTPEPDGFDCRHPGYAWIIEVDESGPTQFRSVRTGTFQFDDVIESRVESEAELNRIRRDFERFRGGRHLVKLRLQGRLDSDLLEQLSAILLELETFAEYLEINTDELLRAIRQSDIDNEFTEGSFPHRLLSALAQSPDDQLALQLGYDLVKEAR